MSNVRGPMVGSLEVRDAINGEIRDVDDHDHTVQAFFPHETVDTYKTTFSPECFRESFAREKPLLCWQHKLEEPIGRAVKAQATRKGNELVGRFSNFDDVPMARRAWSQIKDGTLTDFSFGFKDSKRRPHPDKSLRGVEQIYEAAMKEFSPVSIGSIPGAKATGIRQEDNSLVTELTPEQVAEFVRTQVFTPEQGQAYLLRHYPDLREVIKVVRQNVTADDVRNALEESHPDIALALRTASIALHPAGWEPEPEPDEVVADYAQACGAALDAARSIIARHADDELSEDLRQAMGLVDAAGAVTDDLREHLGIRADTEEEDENVEDEDDWGDDEEDEHPKESGPRREDVEVALRAVNFKQEERDKLAKEGKALPDGSYPIPDGEKGKQALHSAAVLVKSGHGDVAAAKKLIAKRAKELGVKNPLDDDKDSDGRSDFDLDSEEHALRVMERVGR